MKTTHFSCLLLTLLVQVSLLCVLASGQCLDSQRRLLLQLKQSLTFDSSVSTKLVQWNRTTIDCCSWRGVTCRKNSGRVIGLDLDNEGITSEINSSSTLFRLQFLERLNLASNSFNDTQIPSGLVHFTSLAYLNLSNSFSGQVPNVFSRMKKLAVLDLSSSYSLKIEKPRLSIIVQNLTQLAELYLDSVDMSSQGSDWSRAISSSLPNLRILSLTTCQITGPIDSSFGKLQFLSVIKLDFNSLNIPFPESFANLSSLTFLSLHSCNFSGVFPQRILQIPTLQTLRLSYNELLKGSLPEFPRKGSLRELFLYNTNFSGGVPESIGNMGRLYEIDLSQSNFSGRIPQSMANLTQLVRLNFAYNKFSGIIPPLGKSKNLTYIDLSNNQLSGPIPSTHFEGLDNLVHIDLSFNMFNGSIPSSLFAFPLLQNFLLHFNHFDGELNNFSSASTSQLETLTLSSNKLNGPIPASFFDLKNLKSLSLSYNNLSGTLQLERFQKLENLYSLDLSHNRLSITTSSDDSSTSLLPGIYLLFLASCNLKDFPNLRNQSELQYLDLSDNQIGGEIPNWIWNIGQGSFPSVNLSHNLLTSLQEPYVLPKLSYLDLHSNHLTGKIPIPPDISEYADYSSNNFSSSIPPDIGYNISAAYFFSASRNNLTGTIPESICNAANLAVLDLSNNIFSGKIPSCLLHKGKVLEVLNLGNNNLTGNISGTSVKDCGLKSLDLHANQLEGNIPASLANCTTLEVLNLGNNHLGGTFPCFMKSSSSLRVLVLRFNNFNGSILCSGPRNHWPNLQIIDIASNQFNDKVPQNWFVNWTGMMDGKNDAQLKVDYLSTSDNYLDTVTVTVKGLQIELVKILTIFNTIDISNNRLEGEIPDMFGQLKWLRLLNLSHNVFTNSIPASLGNLKQLEALDLSVNKLGGTIPMELASLNFLSFLNLSYNQLTGRIPTASQFYTFEEESFMGNKALCGNPLNISCVEAERKPSSGPKYEQDSSDKIQWEMISAEIGFSVGLGIVVLPLFFYKRWRRYYYEHVDRALSKIIHILPQKRRYQGQRRANGTRARRGRM
ncbi:receptor-like protein 7 [Apium graveolens]|uniref:receptor-like protein 7 n=1 Tax=Apium graveolens TaxID=4045 RepID=UPI003D7A0ACD